MFMAQASIVPQLPCELRAESSRDAADAFPPCSVAGTPATGFLCTFG